MQTGLVDHETVDSADQSAGKNTDDAGHNPGKSQLDHADRRDHACQTAGSGYAQVDITEQNGEEFAESKENING